MKATTRSILAALYNGRRQTPLTHSLVPGRPTALCGRIPASSFADEHATDGNAPPTCTRCLFRDARFTAPKAVAT